MSSRSSLRWSGQRNRIEIQGLNDVDEQGCDWLENENQGLATLVDHAGTTFAYDMHVESVLLVSITNHSHCIK